jgi:hypothetical protein
MIWDGSFLPHWWSTPINDMQRADLSPDIVFGTAFLKHLIRIWNLRISYPFEDIYIWDDDVAGAYRIPKYHPAVASAFAFAIMKLLFLPTGGTFGSTTSPPEYEAFARARAFLAEYFSRDETLVLKHFGILQHVSFDVVFEQDSVTYTQATSDSLIRVSFLPPLIARSIHPITHIWMTL